MIADVLFVVFVVAVLSLTIVLLARQTEAQARRERWEHPLAPLTGVSALPLRCAPPAAGNVIGAEHLAKAHAGRVGSLGAQHPPIAC